MRVSTYLSLIGRRRGWALIRGWTFINFFCFQDRRLFEAGANSRLDAYSNKYGNTQHYPVKRSRESVDLFFFSVILLITVFIPLGKR